MTAALPAEAAGKPVEIGWQDAAGVGQQGRLTRLWDAPLGRARIPPAAPKDCRYAWACLFGAVCPARGVGAGLVLPAANAAMINLHLAGDRRSTRGQISSPVSAGAQAVVIMDGAGWHQTGGELRLPANITPLPLPPDAPELNPVENVWALLRSNTLANRIYDTYDAILDACADAWNGLTSQPEQITAIASRPWAQVKQ